MGTPIKGQFDIKVSQAEMRPIIRDMAEYAGNSQEIWIARYSYNEYCLFL